jgi:hypothetical protein
MQMTNDIAERIAETLFLNGFGERAERLLLVREVAPGSIQVSNGRDLGGWSKTAVAAIIRAELSEVREVLAELESDRWDGDPRRREDDPLCARARALLSKLEVK